MEGANMLMPVESPLCKRNKKEVSDRVFESKAFQDIRMLYKPSTA